VIRRGDSVYVYWTLDENGLLDCELEIKGQAIARRFKTGKMFTIQRAKQNFEGPEGVMLAETTINTAKEELDELRRTLGPRAAAEVAELEKQIERHRVDLRHSYEADTSRSIAEEGRAIRQEISKIKGRRENVGYVLRAETESLVEIFNSAIRPTAGTSAAARFDQLARQARGSIDYGSMEDAKKSISEMQGIFLERCSNNPASLSTCSLTWRMNGRWQSTRRNTTDWSKKATQ